MKCLTRNKTKFHYSLLTDTEEILDEYGNESGESRLVYGEPVSAYANISPAKGTAQNEQFGNDLKYDKVIVTDDINCPIGEDSILFIDKTPECDDDGNYLYDYIVKGIAKSLNSVSIAVEKVR